MLRSRVQYDHLGVGMNRLHTCIAAIGLLSLSALCGLGENTGKTFYTPLTPFQTRSLDTTLRNRWSSEDAAQPTHVRITSRGYYSKTTRGGELGRYFGTYTPETEEVHNYIYVDADDTLSALVPQYFFHDALQSTQSSNATLNPLSQKISFAPTTSRLGGGIEASMYFNEGISLSVEATYAKTTHTLHLSDLVTPVKQNVAGSARSFLDYLAGDVKNPGAHYVDTKNNSTDYLNAQDSVVYGKFLDSQTISSLGDITIGIQAVAHQDRLSNSCVIGVYGILPTGNGSSGAFLFEPMRDNGGHYFFGASLSGRTLLTPAELTFKLALEGSIRAEVGTATTATRSATFMWPEYISNGQLVPQQNANWMRYALAGQTGKSTLFPLINVLSLPVLVSPGARFGAEVTLAGSWRWITARIGYQYHRMGRETITPKKKWNDGWFAIAKQSYAGLAPFDAALDSNGDLPSLTTSDIDWTAAATPHQETHSGVFSLAVGDRTAFIPVQCSLSGAYHFCSATTFGLSGFTIGASISYAF